MRDGDTSSRIAPPVALLERVSDALISLDSDWRFTYLNPAAERLLGEHREQLLEFSLFDRFPEIVGSIFDQKYREAIANGEAVIFEACHPPFGTWVEVHATPSAVGLDIQARDITPGMRAAESLRRWARVDEVRFRALAEHAADIVGLLNADGTVRYISQAVNRVLGYPPETLIGRSALAIVHPEDLPHLMSLFDRDTGSSDNGIPIECRLRDAGGSWRFIELTGNNQLHDPDIAGLVLSARDVTWRKQMERELHTREASFEAVVDASVIGIGVTDLSGHLLTANRAMEAFLGYSEKELAGHNLAEYVHPNDDREESAQIVEKLVRGQQKYYREIKRFVPRNNDIAWGSLSVSLIRELDGNPKLAIVTVEDITERQRTATELADARRRLAASREAERTRLAHELHDGPVQDLLAVTYELSRVSAPVGVGQSTGAPSTAMEPARKRLLAVVGQLRTVVGELRPPGLTEFGLETALHGLVTDLRRQIDAAGQVIRIDVEERAASLPHEIALAIFRIVQEALRNALRHAEARTIVVKICMERSSVEVQIRDDGRGFVVPERVNDFALAGHFGLVGLVERAEQVLGEATVTSAPGEGTTVTVRIPLDEEVRNHHEHIDYPSARR